LAYELSYPASGLVSTGIGDHLWDFGWCLKVDRVPIERMCAGREFQVEGADTEKAREEKLLVILAGLARRLTLLY